MPLNHRSLFFLLLTLVFGACEKEPVTNKVDIVLDFDPYYPDEIFKIGVYDNNDLHLTFQPPLRVINSKWDFDEDGRYDIRFGGFDRPVDWPNGNEWGIEVKSLGAKDWKIAGGPFYDSIFFCGKSHNPYDGFLINNAHFLSSCNDPIDSFVKVSLLTEVPQTFKPDADWPSDSQTWSEEVHYDYTRALQFPPTYFKYYGTLEDTASHYLLFESHRDSPVQKAWIKIHRRFYSSGHILPYIEELAVQKAGTN